MALQGFGRVGTVLAEMLADAGATLVALADDREAVANADRHRRCRRHRAYAQARHGARPAGAEPIDRSTIFGVDCDLFITAGIQYQSTRRPPSSCGPAS